MAQNIIFTLKADASGVRAGMEQASEATKKTKKEVSDTQKQLSVLTDKLKNVGYAIASAFAVGSIVQFGKAVIQVSNEVNSLNIRMNQLYGSANEFDRAMGNMVELSNRLGISTRELTNNYIQFVASAKASGIEVAKAEKIFVNMTQALRGTGASVEATKRAMTALTQMMGKGTIMSEELKGQLGEAMPQAIGWMAESLGVGTKELFKMMEQGKLTSDALLGFSEVAVDKVGGSISKMSNTVEANVQRLQNKWDEYMASLGNRFFGSGGGAEVFISMIDFWIQINQSQDEYLKKESQRLLSNTEENDRAREIIGSLKDQKLTLEQINKEIDLRIQKLKDEANGIVAMNEPMTEQAKNRDRLNNEEKIFNLNLIRALEQERRLLIEAEESKNKGVQLSKEQLKAIEKERKERERIRKEMEEALRAGMEMQAQQEREYRTRELRSQKELKELTRTPLNIAGAEELLTPFEHDMMKLDRLRRRDEINEAEYLNRKLEIQRKYGQNSSQTFDQIFANTKQKAEEEKQARLQFGADTFNGLTTLANTFYQNDLSKQTEALQKRLESGEMSEQQYAEAVRAIKRKAMIADKIAAISQIAINTALNISSPQNAAVAGALTPAYIANGAIQAGIVLAQPIPYNKGTKRVPMMRGAIRGKDSVHAILTPDERVVPADINTQPGYSALLDLAQDRKISDKEAGFIAEMAMGGRVSSAQAQIDPDVIGKAIAKYIPHTSVRINERGIAVITEQSKSEVRRLRTRIG